MAWDKKPSEFMKVVEANLTQHVKDMTAYALQQTVVPSPVDEGAYKGNHRVGIGSPDLEFDPDLKDEDGRGAIERGEAIILQISNDTEFVYVSNSAPYAGRIEHGHSEQAPEGIYAQADIALRNRYGR